MFQNATRHISKHTCLKFSPRTKKDKDYILVIEDKGCSAHLGRVGGAQNVVLNRSCYESFDKQIGVFVHELLHVVGMEHEQERRDRDKYVIIHWENIDKTFFDQFTTEKSLNPTVFPYYYGSFMHYEKYDGSSNGKPGLSSKDSSVKELGQTRGLSKIDIKELNGLFCGATKGSPDCKKYRRACENDRRQCKKYRSKCKIVKITRVKPSEPSPR